MTASLAALLAAFPFIVNGIIAFKRDQDLYNPANNPFIYNLDPTTEHVRVPVRRHRVPDVRAATR